MALKKDRRVLGQTNTFYERGVDFDRLRQARLAKTQAEMAARDIGALLLTDIVNIRYTTGIAVMPIWTATNLAHYIMVPVTGDPIIFEDGQARFRAKEFFDDVRSAYYWQARFAEQLAAENSMEWSLEVKDVLHQWGVDRAKLGVDKLDFYGFRALQQQGLNLTDADEPLERARQIKTRDEIELMRQAAAVCEAALFDMEQAIRPGVSENELLGVYWHTLCALGGEYVFCRLLASGSKTNPWFHEAGSKMVRPGDLAGFDTDTTMPQGEFKENMVVSVEFYAGKVGEQDGVNLEDEIWITDEGPVQLSLYPYEEKLLG